MKTELRFAVFGTGFWAQYQIPAWFEVGGVKLVALYNRTRSKAERLAEKYQIPHIYDDPEKLLKNEELDFIDIITEVPAHAPLVRLAAQYRVPTICQKPMAPDYVTCQEMVNVCKKNDVPLFIHENFRWQRPIREIKHLLEQQCIGEPFRARISFNHYTSFLNQPFVQTLEHLILTDAGSHMLDLARFLFGEVESLYCDTQHIRPEVCGEDVATVFLKHRKVSCCCEMSFTTRLAQEKFPQTSIIIEGDKGCIELRPDYWIHITTEEGTLSNQFPPPHYAWSHPNYEVVHSSIVECNRDLLLGLKGEKVAETTAEDNLNTMRLVYASYESAATEKVIPISV